MTEKNNTNIVVIAAFLAVVAVAFFYFFVGFPKDPASSCTQAGGIYNPTTKACETDKPKPNPENGSEMPFLQTITYSNLADEASKQELKTALAQAGIDEDNIANFFESVNNYNQTIENTSLNQGFSVSENLNPIYDEATMIQKWEAKNPEFIGHNCRITSYNLMRDFIAIDNPNSNQAGELFADKDAIAKDAQKLFSPEELTIFDNFFAKVTTSASTDVSEHLAKVAQAWKEKGVKFLHNNDKTKASLVSVWFHDHFEGEEPYVFIGHIGVLVPTADTHLFFIEKISFTEPYQVFKFKNRTEVSDYLMNKYDTAYGQDTAIPFVLENDALIEGYRPNPKKGK